MDAATPVDGDHQPSEGDLTICISCAQVLVFDDRLATRRPEQGELEAAYRRDPKAADGIRDVQRAIRSLNRTGLRLTAGGDA
jgi:hypothetical protein